eukprot:g4475.t1
MLRSFSKTNALPKALLRRQGQHLQQSRNLNNLRVGVCKEVDQGEARVVITPTNVEQLIKKGAVVSVEKGAGSKSGFSDALYENAGASIVSGDEVWKQDMVLKLREPTPDMLKKLENRTLINSLGTRINPELRDQLAQQGATCFDLTMLLRTLSRGQTFDVISSQANMAGYRAVIEAGHFMQRPFAGQMTAAGKIPPTRVMVVGAGVAGLAAIQSAKNLGAIVTAFDVRAAAAEQVESMGAQFLKVEFEEDGSGAGGYAKEMSKEWFDAADKMLLKEMERTNVIITTALIPGRPAPVLIKKHHTDAMAPGSVIIDLAAENGGNCDITEKDKIVDVNGVTAVGYTNMPSRMSTTSSTLFGNNVTKFLLSMEREGEYVVDLENDEAVRSMCVVHKGKKLDEYVPPPPEVTETAAAVEVVVEEVDPQKEMMSSAKNMTVLGSAATLMGAGVPNAPMLSTLALSVWVGSGAVQGVTHALHSPLMSVTNAISGMTMIGGMLQLGGGVMPHNSAQVLATTAVTLSAVNLTGGFMVTQKMLDLFRRPDDPPEYWHYYMAPFGVIGGGYVLASATGAASASLTPTVALISGLGCIGGIACLSDQKTARAGVSVGMGGVGLGILAAMGTMAPESKAVWAQLGLFSLLGGAVGHQLAARIEPTSLPQAVAGFHCLVGIAAASTAVGDFLVHDMSHMDGFHSAAIYLGAWMGSITFTGSVIACGKLAEVMDTKPLQLAGRDYINMGLGSTTALSMLAFMGSSSPTVAGTALGYGVLSSGALGFHMTASIGGADMPVVVTLLNSYSGWALCAEGFILDQPVLTIVGALIGSSGAFLTKIMCDGMNRDLTGVIMGGFGTEAGAVQTAEGLVHTEVDSAQATQAMLDAQKVMITPGYGLAVAQAQNAVAEIATKLKKMGKDVTFGVHPVAGRMPGQLNVLLAEAGVPYDIVYEMEEVNEEMADTQVALVVGANDTVNCLAEDDPNCAIGGMPVIQVWNAEQVLFMKRSMASGYAGVDNPVFYKDNTDMWLGDAKKSLDEMNVLLAEQM